MLKSGTFICRKCRNNTIKNFTDWQEKDNKWIFGRKFEFLDFSKPNWQGLRYKWTSGKTTQWDDESPEKCWEKAGGSTVDEWNKYQPWKCDKCECQYSTFLEFVYSRENKSSDCC